MLSVRQCLGDTRANPREFKLMRRNYAQGLATFISRIHVLGFTEYFFQLCGLTDKNIFFNSIVSSGVNDNSFS